MPGKLEFSDHFTGGKDFTSPYQINRSTKSAAINALSNTETKNEAISLLGKYQKLKLAIEGITEFKDMIAGKGGIGIDAIAGSVVGNYINGLINAGIYFKYTNVLSEYKIGNISLDKVYYDDIRNILINDLGLDIAGNILTKMISNKTVSTAAEVGLQALKKTHEKIVNSVKKTETYILSTLSEMGISGNDINETGITIEKIKLGTISPKPLMRNYHQAKQSSMNKKDLENIQLILNA